MHHTSTSGGDSSSYDNSRSFSNSPHGRDNSSYNLQGGNLAGMAVNPWNVPSRYSAKSHGNGIGFIANKFSQTNNNNNSNGSNHPNRNSNGIGTGFIANKFPQTTTNSNVDNCANGNGVVISANKFPQNNNISSEGNNCANGNVNDNGTGTSFSANKFPQTNDNSQGNNGANGNMDGTGLIGNKLPQNNNINNCNRCHCANDNGTNFSANKWPHTNNGNENKSSINDNTNENNVSRDSHQSVDTPTVPQKQRQNDDGDTGTSHTGDNLKQAVVKSVSRDKLSSPVSSSDSAWMPHDSSQDPSCSPVPPHERMWPLNYINLVRVLHRQVRIFGVFSGYALVALLDAVPTSHYYKCCPIQSGFPGDTFLWQPPTTDVNRGKSCIDTASVMAVILLDRPSSSRLRVRVTGVEVLLEVDPVDVYEFPRLTSELWDLSSAMKCRQVTLVRMAGVPPMVDCTDRQQLSQVYFSPATANNGTDYIFELCTKRGAFLNVAMLLHFFIHGLPQLSLAHRRGFVDYLMDQLDLCKGALSSSFEDMVLNKVVTESMVCSVLLPIDNDEIQLDNKMLLGCRLYSIISSKCPIGNSELKLERIIYSRRSNSFHYYDDNMTQVDIARTRPIVGLYILNENFANSRLAHVSALRFQMAMLLYIPDYSKLKSILSSP